MNHLGVALASDSVVTMSKKGRTYSTVNKIFSLAGRQPIAIMISDSASYIPGDVAWERVIGQFREHIGLDERPQLWDYVVEFRKFVSSSTILNDPGKNDRAIQADLVEYFTQNIIRIAAAREEMTSHDSWAVAKLIYDVPEVGDYLNQGIVERIDNLVEQVERMSSWKSVSKWYEGERERWDNHAYTTKKRHGKNAKMAAKYFCERHECPKSCAKKMEQIFLFHLTSYGSQFYWKTKSQMAFAGFGETEITPELITCLVGSEVHEDDAFGDFEYHAIRPRIDYEDSGELRNEVDPESNVKMYSGSAMITPFAQKDEMQTTLNGINIWTRHILLSRMPDYIRDSVTDSILDHLDDLDGFGPSRMDMIKQCMDENKESITRKITKEVEGAIDHTRKKRREMFRQVTSRVPMEELANFAKTMVALEAEITHYVKDIRSVGGPIDLATITKEDGFLWIETKQSVDSSKNPRQIDIERHSANIG